MNRTLLRGRSHVTIITAIFATLACPTAVRPGTTVFFTSSQTTNLVASGETSDTISSEAYLFTLTRDKLFTGGIGLPDPIGRAVRVPWPAGLEAQAVTVGPVLSKAKIVITREDGQLFAIDSFTAQLLANTAGAGGSFEIMPLLNGEDGAPNPFMYNATGIAGNHFTYGTPGLTSFDAYIVTLYVDYALTSLTVVDASPPPPYLDVFPVGGASLELSWPASAAGYTLVSATSLPASAWTAVTNTVTTNLDVVSVQLDAAGAARFFRLQK